MSEQEWITAALHRVQAAVIQHYASYCEYVDVGQWDALAELFAQDAVFRIGDDRAYEGRAVLRDFFMTSRRGTHLTGLPLVSEVTDGEVASSASFMYVANGISVVQRGVYRDRLRVQGGRCEFIERVVHMRPHTLEEL